VIAPFGAERPQLAVDESQVARVVDGEGRRGRRRDDRSVRSWAAMRRQLGPLMAVALCAAAGGPGEARGEARARRPATGAPLTPAELGWPTSPRSLQVTTRTDVFATPGKRHLGAIAKGTRLAWTKIVASRDRCRAWIEVEPRGWVCAADVTPSDLGPEAGIDPDRVVTAALAKTHAGVVPRGADAYATRVAALAGTPWKRAPGWAFLRHDTEIVRIGKQRYYRTRHGYIATRDVEPRKASTWTGVDLRASAQPWPLAWIVPRRRGQEVVARSAPAAGAAEAARYPGRQIVAVLEERAGFVRIADDRWVSLEEVRIARSAPRPRGVGADERWIDVDLDQQVLVAYEGERPVYATMISSGIGRSTPTALHRIAEKRMVARMKSPDVALGKWDMPDVPFAMTFREHYALHGVYWHDSFGKKRSHGCINVTPRDARFLFSWTYPQLPPGWIQGVADDDTGTPIRLRNARDPDPGWTDFHAPPPVPTREAPPADLEE
jgi:hypothetical protein